MNIIGELTFDIAMLLGLLFFVLWTLYLRLNREKLLNKYPPASPRRNEVDILLRTRRLVIGMLVMTAFMLKTIFDIYRIQYIYGDSARDYIMFAVTSSGLICTCTLVAIFVVFKKTGILIKP